jgi:pyrimidine-nucleoside phosphorylase
MNMVDLILAKRKGYEHSQAEIDFIINGVMQGWLPDYQLTAWLMAVCLRGMTVDETAFLTQAYVNSGQVLDLSACAPVVADKHSTGGVGDKTSLILVPLLAAAGLPMALLSGRALGHTGGTLDKLEAIPGFNCALTKDQFVRQVRSIGAAISGQTSELAPADGKIYALRDVTGTVESIALIVASIVSKKLAAGTNLIVLDVKCGAGAIMETQQQAEELAFSIMKVGKRLGKSISAVITDMDQPLGFAVGHTLEVIESIETLRGHAAPDLLEVCLALGSVALTGAGKASDEIQARKMMQAAIDDGSALSKFKELVAAQSGDCRVVDDYRLMPHSKLKVDFTAPFQGERWVAAINGRHVAQACAVMGAARKTKSDAINLAVGVVLHAKVGAPVTGGQSLATIHADSQETAEEALTWLKKAYSFSEQPATSPPVVRRVLAAERACAAV